MESGIPDQWRKRLQLAFPALIRSIGAGLGGVDPFWGGIAAAMVQLDNEMAMARQGQRIDALEDPMTQIHPEAPDVAAWMLRRGAASGDTRVQFVPTIEEYEPLRRAVQKLESKGILKKAGKESLPAMIWVHDPMFVLYACQRHGNRAGLADAMGEVYQSERGDIFRSDALAQKYDVPPCVIHAIFRTYEGARYGTISSDMDGVSEYVSA